MNKYQRHLLKLYNWNILKVNIPTHLSLKEKKSKNQILSVASEQFKTKSKTNFDPLSQDSFKMLPQGGSAKIWSLRAQKVNNPPLTWLFKKMTEPTGFGVYLVTLTLFSNVPSLLLTNVLCCFIQYWSFVSLKKKFLRLLWKNLKCKYNFCVFNISKL